MKNNRPEIQFSGFSGDWKERKLGELIQISSASRVRKEEWTTSGVRFFRSSDVVSRFYGKKNKPAFISYELYDKLSKKSGSVQPGDILVTGGGTIGIPYLVVDQEPLYFKDADLIWLKSANKINGYFLYTYFSSPKLRKYISSITHIGTISHYTIEQAKDTPILLPEQVEQNKIGKFLKQLDDTIALYQQELTTLKKTKQGFLQKMFPREGESVPEFRFPGFTGLWEVRKLDSIVDKVKSYSLSRDVETSEYTGYKYIHYGDIHTKVADVIDGSNNLPNIKTGNYDLLEKGDLVLADASEDYQGIATPAVITVDLPYMLVSGLHTIALRPKPKVVNSLFLYYLINSPIFRKYGYKAGTGMKVFGISATNLLKFESMFPVLEEQTQIGIFLKRLDDTIALHQRELDALKETKKAFLQKMFV